jgi:Sigma-70 region 2
LDCPDGFMDFVSATAPRLRRTAYLLCGDWHTAQDLTQATLVRVFARRGRCAGRRGFERGRSLPIVGPGQPAGRGKRNGDMDADPG